MSEKYDVPFTRITIICQMNRLGLSGKGGTRPSICRPPLRRQDLSPVALEALREKEREKHRSQRALQRAKRGDAPITERRERPASAPRTTPRTVSTAPPRTPAPAVAPPRPRPVGILPSLDIPLTELREGQCPFIAIDPLDVVPAPCCGHPVDEGSKWCPGHRRLCTMPSRPNLWTPPGGPPDAQHL